MMKKELAQYIAEVGFKSSSTLNDLIPLIKSHSNEEEYRVYARAIANISATISLELLQVIYERYPDIESEIDRKIQEYDRLI